jgi:hypothetical protein
MPNSEQVEIQGKVVILGASQHPHAVDCLKWAWPDIDWIYSRDEEDIPHGIASVSLITDTEKPEGSYSLTVGRERTPKISIEGGPFSGVIYGVEELIQRKSSVTGSRITVQTGVMSASPALVYRSFWTWDHSTNWELSQIGQQEIGVFNPYSKPPGGFLADYKRLVDFCSANQIAAVIIYGFLRDSHRGIASAQELCRYANKRGVRIIPGIAIGAYGGVYWEGKNKYNLATWLKQNPEYASQMTHDVGFQVPDLAFPLSFPLSDYTLSACPSAPETMVWMEEAVSWLVDTFDIGGINIESGDYGVCTCHRCINRRRDREFATRDVVEGDYWSHSDLADNFPRLFREATSKRKDLWIYCELQWDNLLEFGTGDQLKHLPEGAIYQHTMNRSYWNRAKSELKKEYMTGLPINRNTMRFHLSSQWNGDERTERYSCNAPVIAEISKKANEVGMDGFSIWGEASPHHVSVELNYLAFGRFGYNPNLSWADFKTEEIDPRLGGSSAADEFLLIMHEIDSNQKLSASRLRELSQRSRDGISNVPQAAVGRWVWLSERLNQRLSMGS